MKNGWKGRWEWGIGMENEKERVAEYHQGK